MTTELFNAWWENHGTSAKKASELADPVLKIIDPHERGRQYVSGQLEKFTGTRVGGFLLTRNKGENYREAATYRLEQTEAPSAESPSLDTPDGTLAKAREAGAFFRLDPLGDLFIVEWPGPSHPNLDAAIRQHYVAILAILTNEER
jgi:hypothetical protein